MAVDVTSVVVRVQDIGDDEVESLALLFKLLSDANRLRIVALLMQGERCVCDIEAATRLQQNLVSHHLRVLRDANLIGCRRDGRWAYYRINRAELERVHPCVSMLFNPDHLSDARAAC